MAGTPYFTAGTDRPGMSGRALFQLDDGTTATVFDPPTSMISFRKGFAPAYPQLVDALSVLHNKALGEAQGEIRIAGPVGIDRRFDFMLTQGFGARSNVLTDPNLPPFFSTLSRFGGDTPFCQAGVWWASFGMSGKFDMSGTASVIGFEAQAMVLDPLNVSAAVASTPPATSGTTGLNLSSFQTCRFTDGGVTPNTYDDIASFSLELQNQLIVIPAANSDPTLAAAGIAKGCAGGIIRGQVTITQNDEAALSIPTGNGVYGFNIIIADPARAHALNLALSLSYNADVSAVAPAQVGQTTAVYDLFGSANSNAWPMIATYA